MQRLATAPLLALALVAACSSPGPSPADLRVAPELADMTWMLGLWRAGVGDGSGPRPAQFEHWQIADDGSLISANYQRVQGEVVPNQNSAMRVDPMGRVVLELTKYQLVGERYVPSPLPTYRLAESGPDFARFEGPDGVVPRSFLYQKGPKGQLVLSLVLPSADGEKEYFVSFDKVSEE
ncbi:MAG: hypothetical protein R3F34_19120 [Planctomycetota bacterium]